MVGRPARRRLLSIGLAPRCIETNGAWTRSKSMDVSPKERRFVASFALGLVLVTCVPYVLGHALHFPESRFNENLVFDDDLNTYFAFMRQAASGQWLFHNPMTPEPHEPVFFNLEWLVMGKLAAWFEISLETVFQLERIGSTILLCFSFYWLTSFLFATPTMRRVVFTAVLLGGGFGWLLSIPKLSSLLPADLFLDTYAGLHPFFWILLQPHFTIAQAFALLCTCFYIRAETTGPKSYPWAALCCVVAGSMRPFEMLYLVVAISLYALVTTVWTIRSASLSRILLRLLPVFAAIPLFAYYVWLLEIHPVFRWWGAQNVVPSPNPGSLFLSLGIAAILLVLGLKNLTGLKKRPAAQLFVICCLASSLGLLYSFPLLTFSLQFLPALVIPTALMGTMKLEPRLVSFARIGRRARLAIAAFLVLNSLTSILLLGTYVRAVAEGKHRTGMPLIEAYRWLQEHSEPRDVVLAAFPIVNQLPRYTHASSLAGYGYTTVDFPRKAAMMRKFFRADTDDGFRQSLIDLFDVRYVCFGEWDRQQTEYDPATTPFLREAYRNRWVAVFEVESPTR
jgi:hypothetical protein